MRGAMAVLTREIHERRMILVAALVAGLIPLASPLFPGVSAERVVEAREVLALVLALAFSLALAAMLGATIVGSDLSEGRLGFDFVRPLGAPSIWTGRFFAAFFLVLAVQVAVVAPSVIVSGGLTLQPIGDLDGATAFLGTFVSILALIPLAHLTGLVFRARSRWLVLDLVAGCIVILVSVAAASHIYNAFAESVAWGSAIVVAVSAVPVLWLASAVQLVRGRTDLARSHRAQALVLWPALLVLSLAYFGYSRWFTSVDPDDLRSPWTRGESPSSWILVEGEARWRPEIRSSFLLDSISGNWIGLPRRVRAPRFSADGTRVAWLGVARPGAPTTEVMVADLEGAKATVRATTIVLNSVEYIWDIAISPTGRRLAVLVPPSLTIYDLDTGASVFSVKLEELADESNRNLLAFATEERVRLYALGRRLTIHDIDVPTRRLHSVQGPAIDHEFPWLRWSPDHRRLLLRTRDLLLVDAATAESLMSIEPPIQDGRFLADGRIVVVGSEFKVTPRLRLLAHDGTTLRTIGLEDRFGWCHLGGEIAPAVLLVSGYYDDGGLRSVDLETGSVIELDDTADPVATEEQAIPAPGSVASRLVYRDSALLLLEGKSFRHLVGPG